MSLCGALGEVGQGLRDQGERNVEVDDEDAEDEDGEGEGGGDAGEDGQRDGGDDEEGHDAGVDGIEERHGDARFQAEELMDHDMACG